MSDFVLREILESNKDQEELLRHILRIEQANMGFLSQIAADLNPQPLVNVESFTVTRSDSMNPIVPGTTAVYTATPVPAGATLTKAPTWTSSDPTNAPVTVDTTGLIATMGPAGVPGTFTLSINYTNADGTVANGAITDTIVAPPPPAVDVTSFTIVRTS